MEPHQKQANIRFVGERPKPGDNPSPQSGLTALTEPAANLRAEKVAVPLTLINRNRFSELAKAHPERVCVILQHIGALIAKCVLRNRL